MDSKRPQSAAFGAAISPDYHLDVASSYDLLSDLVLLNAA